MSSSEFDSDSDAVEFTLKFVTNKENNKVLFAVIDHNLADVLLSFLTLPLGSILRILDDYYDDSDDDDNPVVIGSLNSLQKSVENLDSAHFGTVLCKNLLLNPRNSMYSDCRKLLINVEDTEPVRYFTCEKWSCGFGRTNVRMYGSNENERCECGSVLNRELRVKDEVIGIEEGSGDAFLVDSSTYLVGDDLRLVPDVKGSVLRSLEALGIGVSDVDGVVEEETATFGYSEIMDLLRSSLFSKAPLTDTILHEGQISRAKSKKFTSPSQMVKEEASNPKKFIVTLMLQKSTNKLLFAQCDEDFVDFLFSFLTIPLGEVERLLGSSSSLGSIDNLYKSLQNLSADRYMRNPNNKDMLLKPKLSPKYLSKHQVFSLDEENHPQLYYYINAYKRMSFLSTTYIKWGDSYENRGDVYCKDPKGEGSYVKGSGMYMVADDLSVTPLCMLSSFSVLEQKKISICDVKELEIGIGLKEGLSILKASLTSTSPLTEALAPLIWEKPKEEQ